jgi:hypothetical protein
MASIGLAMLVRDLRLQACPPVTLRCATPLLSILQVVRRYFGYSLEHRARHAPSQAWLMASLACWRREGLTRGAVGMALTGAREGATGCLVWPFPRTGTRPF